MLKTIWRRHLTGADKILLCSLTVLALSSYGIAGYWQSPGERLYVEVDNRLRASFSLDEDGLYHCRGSLGEMTIQIKEGAGRVWKAPCPRQICREMGWIKNRGEVIVCLPNRVLLRVGENKKEGGFDALAH